MGKVCRARYAGPLPQAEAMHLLEHHELELELLLVALAEGDLLLGLLVGVVRTPLEVVVEVPLLLNSFEGAGGGTSGGAGAAAAGGNIAGSAGGSGATVGSGDAAAAAAAACA